MKKYVGILLLTILLGCEAENVNPFDTDIIEGKWKVIAYEVEGKGVGKLKSDVELDTLPEFTFDLKGEELGKKDIEINFITDTSVTGNSIQMNSTKIPVILKVKSEGQTPTIRSNEPFPFKDGVWKEESKELIITLNENGVKNDYPLNKESKSSDKLTLINDSIELPALIKSQLMRNMEIKGDLTGKVEIKLERIENEDNNKNEELKDNEDD